MKSEMTKRLERLLNYHFIDRNHFYVFECTIGWYGREIVDCIMYDTSRDVHCYEIKSSVADFRSKHNKTFIGNKNYYVMPRDVYEKIQDEIPKEIGVYVLHECEFGESLVCIKHCRRIELRADKEVILSSMLRSMQRDMPRDRIRLNTEAH